MKGIYRISQKDEELLGGNKIWYWNRCRL